MCQSDHLLLNGERYLLGFCVVCSFGHLFEKLLCWGWFDCPSCHDRSTTLGLKNALAKPDKASEFALLASVLHAAKTAKSASMLSVSIEPVVRTDFWGVTPGILSHRNGGFSDQSPAPFPRLKRRELRNAITPIRRLEVREATFSRVKSDPVNVSEGRTRARPPV